jgi:hypothetical protein
MILSVLLLGTLFSVSAWSANRLSGLCGRTDELLAMSEKLSETDTEAAARFAEGARALWEAAEGFTRIFYRHDSLDLLNESFLVYESALRQDDAAAHGALRLLRARLAALLDEERLTLRSLI